jgi:hypothetical protein
VKTFFKHCDASNSGFPFLKSVLTLLGASFLMICSTVYASHFRGGSFNSAQITANGHFSGTFVTVWRKNDLQNQEVQLEIYRADDLDKKLMKLMTRPFKRVVIDNSDPAFTVAESKVRVNFSRLPHGLYLLRYTNCCRVHNIRNKVDMIWGVGITVNWNGKTNSPPVFNSSPVVRLARHKQVPFDFEVNANDADGDFITYRLVTDTSQRSYGAEQIPGMELHPRLGLLSVKSADTLKLDDGLYVIKVAATDSTGSSSEWDMMIDARALTNKPPVIEAIEGGSSQSVDIGKTLKINNIRASDPDGDSVILTATGLPNNSAFTSMDGKQAEGFFTFTPKKDQSGKTFGINIQAKDENIIPLITHTNLQIMVNELRKINQVIDFKALSDRRYNQGQFSVNATTSSSLPVRFDVVGQCKISGKIITPTGAGNCKVIASQTGNASYNTAHHVERQFKILQKNKQTITFDQLTDKKFGDAPFTVNAKTSSGLPVSWSTTGTCRNSANQVTITGLGHCIVTAEQGGNAKYSAAPNVSQRFNIVKGNQAIKFGSLADKIYGDKPFVINATASSGLPVHLIAAGNCRLSDNQVTLMGAGSCQIIASQKGDANYHAAKPVPQSFQIAKAAQSISFSSLANKIYGDKPFAVSATASSGLPVSNRGTGNCTLKDNQVTLMGAGSCQITASQKGDANYHPAKAFPQSFQIAKAAQSISFSALANKIYGDKPFIISAEASSGLSVNFHATGSCTIKANRVNITGVGSCQVTASQKGSANYKIANAVSQRFNISKAAQSITFKPLPNKTFGDKPFAVSAKASSGLPIELSIKGNCVLKDNLVAITGAGTCQVTASEKGNANYKAAQVVFQRFNIGKAAQSITFKPLPDKIYGDKPFAVSAKTTSVLPISLYVSGNCSIKENLVAIKSAGSCKVTASQSGDTNYKAARAKYRSFKIDKIAQTLDLNPLPDKSYGDKPFAINAKASSGLPVELRVKGSCALNAGQVTITGVGYCHITASQKGNINYTAAQAKSQRFKIGKAAQTITFKPLPDKSYGDKPFTVSAKASSGLPISGNASGNCTLKGDQVTITGVGSCHITAEQQGDVHYKPAMKISQVFKIGKAAQSITFKLLSNKIYGDKPFTIMAVASSGLPVRLSTKNNRCILKANSVTITGAGACKITASQAGDANYKPASTVSQTVKIDKATQTITFKSLPDKTYGEKPFLVSAETSSGLPVSSSASGNCTIKGNQVIITGAGRCEITVSQKGNANYKPALPVSQAFNIGKAAQSITFDVLDDKRYSKKPFAVNATASSGLPVKFSTSAPCTIKGNQIQVTRLGRCQVMASQAGNANYKAAVSVLQCFDVSKANQTITFNALGDKAYGNTFSLMATSDSGLPISYKSSNLAVAKVNGKKVTTTGIGTTTITALQAGNAYYNAAEPVSQKLIIYTTQAGTIYTIHVNLAENIVKVFLTGRPKFGAGACRADGTGNSLDDEKFGQFVMPLLRDAKSNRQRVRIWVSGCYGSYPKIYAIDLEPRK